MNFGKAQTCNPRHQGSTKPDSVSRLPSEQEWWLFPPLLRMPTERDAVGSLSRLVHEEAGERMREAFINGKSRAEGRT